MIIHKNKFNPIDHIGAYFAGTLSPSELQSFEVALETDMDLQAKVLAYETDCLSVDTSSSAYMEDILMLKDIRENVEVDYQQKARIVQLPRRRVLVMVASVLILVVAGIGIRSTFFKSSNKTELMAIAKEQLPKPETYTYTSNNNSKLDALYEEGKYLFKTENYQGAIKIFKQLEANGEESLPIFMYRGWAYFMTHNYPAAIKDFKVVYEDALTDSRKDAGQFYLAIAYLANNDKDSAKSLLTKLLEFENRYKSQAQRLLTIYYHD